MASIIHLPMPGQEKIVSVSTAPASSVPTCRPMVVTTGISALRKAWKRGDAALGQALGAGGAHVVFAQHLEHGRAGLARDDGERNGAEHDRGQDQMLHGRLEGALLAGQQAVDQHEAGDGLEIDVEVDAALTPGTSAGRRRRR